MSVKQAFDSGAEDYDLARRQLIPCFDDFYGTALQLITFEREAAIRVLDLGAGTGLFSSLVAKRYPNAEFTLYDLSDRMLDGARKRFAQSDVNVAFAVKDYSTEIIAGEFDLIISALSIHHLTDRAKESLFQKLFACFNKNGLFINADQVLGETPAIENVYRSSWLKQVREKGVSEASLSAALKRMEEDKMSTLSRQLDWLRKAHFSEVNCWYQNYSFVVYSGQKKSS
ncbi:MAG: class I SAM-dependent methyltransferase [Desulfobulbaceae bacterium]|nr:class I SAM-dependent methyltransferase [Desulfobulbaceae bacterium]